MESLCIYVKNFLQYLTSTEPSDLRVRSSPSLPISDILRNRRPLLESDVPVIHAQIAHIKKELDTSEAQWRALSAPSERLMQCTPIDTARHRKVKGLWMEQRDMEREIKNLHSVLSPIRRLPVDVLHEIFLHSLENQLGSKGIKRDPPWNISWVCTVWREVALSSSALWSRIRLDTPRSSGAAVILDTMLRRSRNRPLDITLGAACSTRMHSQLLVERLVEESERWRTLSLTVRSDVMELFDLAITRVPLLEDLSLTVCVDPDEPYTDVPYFGMLYCAPRLSRVKLLSGGLGGARFDHAALKSYEGLVRKPEDLRELGSYQALEDCTLSFSRSYYFAGGYFHRFRTPLQHNSIRFLRVDNIYIIESLELPNLEALCVGDVMSIVDSLDHPCVSSLIEMIYKFLCRSRCRLKSLTLMYEDDMWTGSGGEASLRLLDSQADSLTFLQVRAYNAKTMFEQLTPRSVAPRLRHLVVYSQQGFQHCAKEMLDMVRVRRFLAGSYPLQHLVVASQSRAFRWADKLYSYREDGLRLDIERIRGEWDEGIEALTMDRWRTVY